ncbi:GNAT family N-acetyltransferase [Nocardioides silvaticus]|uniref:GNAT family N-acetyltransferase n=1 Tax=Nocardioides silvaticus TaxID=2201891 RepID=A0A316TI89_9ACTN|nr:GNAT family N-acetyltransferase [Nocardioides silvaticus]PWN03508.1 GNAT family N-acetyltransferase [Nocardioides silvaticus]
MTTADVSVRVAWAQDAAAIAAVQRRAWEQRYDALLPDLLTERGLDADTHAEAWQATLARPPEARHRALVALERATVVGFVLTGPATDPDADPAVEGAIGELTVHPERVREGHGSRLLQAAVDTLVADGFTRVTTWVDSTDDETRAFLAGAGWEPDGASRELADETGAGTVKQVRLHASIGDPPL